MLPNFMRHLPAVLALQEQSSIDHPFWRVANFVVFVIVLVYIFRNRLKIGELFDNRAALIARQIEEAKHEKQEADQRLAELDARLAKLDQDLADIRANAEAEADRETERIRKSADADAEKIRQLALREIDGALRAAQSQLRVFVAEQSVSLAETAIKRSMRTEDDQRIFGEYLNEIDEVKK